MAVAAYDVSWVSVWTAVPMGQSDRTVGTVSFVTAEGALGWLYGISEQFLVNVSLKRQLKGASEEREERRELAKV